MLFIKLFMWVINKLNKRVAKSDEIKIVNAMKKAEQAEINYLKRYEANKCTTQ